MTTEKKAAPKTSKTGNLVFASGACHHRNADGKPDCKKAIWLRASGKPVGNLCETHERAWRVAARARYDARQVAKPAEVPVAKDAKPRSSAKPPRGKVIPLMADEAPLDPMEREMAAVKAMKVRRVEG